MTNIRYESEPKANPNPRDTEAAFHKCNQCVYASVKAHNLKRHLKIQFETKTLKSHEWDYVSAHTCENPLWRIVRQYLFVH